MEDEVAITGRKLDLRVRAGRFRLGREQKLERLVDMGRDRLAGDDAALGKAGLEPAACADYVAVAFENRMGVEPIERLDPHPLGDPLAVGLVGAELDPVAVADPVELDAIVDCAHASLPSAS